jgi:hypothetical protein
MSQKTVKIKKTDVLNQIATPSIKNSPLAKGAVVVTGDRVAGMSYKRGSIEVTPDNILCEVDGRFVTVPVAELYKMTTKDGKRLLDLSNDEVEIPAKFTVESTSERKNNDGETMYPAASYKGYSAYINKADRTMEDYAALLKTERLAGAKPILDYVVVL